MQQILRLFPPQLREWIRESGILSRNLEEIRIRVQQPLLFFCREGEFFLKGRQITDSLEPGCQIMTPELIRQICMLMSRYSLYAYAEEIRKGYLTVEGGHRVGVCGMVSCEGDKIRRIHPVSYLNIRIAHEQIGCADTLLPHLIVQGEFQNTLILSAPGIGKTTLLRDLVRQLSDGKMDGKLYVPARKVGLVDERSEIAGCIDGVPQNDVGLRTDVLDGCPKAEGMMLLIRAMSPQILAVDEIGGSSDMRAIHQALRCGCRLAATIHSTDVEELSRKPGWDQYLSEHLFERYVVLGLEDGMRTFQVFSGSLERIC